MSSTVLDKEYTALDSKKKYLYDKVMSIRLLKDKQVLREGGSESTFFSFLNQEVKVITSLTVYSKPGPSSVISKEVITKSETCILLQIRELFLCYI